MPELKPTTCKVFKENIAKHTLFEIIHHEMGNGLAIIAGYTRFLQQLSTLSKEEKYSDKYEFYVQTIAQREKQLDDFLSLVRELVSKTSNQWCQQSSRMDMTSAVKLITDQLEPLFPNLEIRMEIPEYPLYILCDPLWTSIVIEHVLNHNIAFHQGPNPVLIKLVVHENSHLHEAQMGVYVKKRIGKRLPITGMNTFEKWAQTLDEHDQDVCMAMCIEVLQELKGRIWVEEGDENYDIMYISLPTESTIEARS